MNYIDFTAGGKEYKLRLNIRNSVVLFQVLGCNPLTIFGDGDKIPTVTTMVQILLVSLQQLNHGITLDNAYTIFDEWLADGHTVMDFLAVIIDIYKVSGIIQQEQEDAKN